ncbi:MAG: hypothetical protein EOP48_19540 [Sphingobacteriales bacterium]|nr:MAG: hypothetical protein EOP48_19540 [Sphingobacteriales bacterium]
MIESSIQENPAKADRPKRTRSVNNSIKGTIDLFTNGKNIEEIAAARKLGINTVENHLLEALKVGEIGISLLLSSERIQRIQNEITQAGTNVYDLKEKLGDQFSFFEIRMVITEFNRQITNRESQNSAE